MPILTFFRQYWVLGVVFGAFILGYYIRGVQCSAMVLKSVVRATANANQQSQLFEDKDAKITQQFENLQIKNENDYTCLIPADGLLLLREATR